MFDQPNRSAPLTSLICIKFPSERGTALSAASGSEPVGRPGHWRVLLSIDPPLCRRACTACAMSANALVRRWLAPVRGPANWCGHGQGKQTTPPAAEY